VVARAAVTFGIMVVESVLTHVLSLLPLSLLLLIAAGLLGGVRSRWEGVDLDRDQVSTTHYADNSFYLENGARGAFPALRLFLGHLAVGAVAG
jgi:hypothetical protein